MGKKSPESRYIYDQRITRLEYQMNACEEDIQLIRREIERIHRDFDCLLKRFAFLEKTIINLNAIAFERLDAQFNKCLIESREMYDSKNKENARNRANSQVKSQEGNSP